jgi:protein phosphatase 1 regulatory subunit 10
MESSIYTWLQPDSPHLPVHSSPPAQDWQKQSTSQAPPAASPQQQPPLDLDFSLPDIPTVSAAHIPRNPSLNGLPAASTSSTSAASPPSSQSSFYPFSGHTGLNSSFYGAGSSPYYAWPPTQPSQSPDPIPLSSYSTLNGATSSSTGSSTQQQQQQSPQMVIECVFIHSALGAGVSSGEVGGGGPDATHQRTRGDQAQLPDGPAYCIHSLTRFPAPP